MNIILDLLFPKKCVGCKRLDTYFCRSCIENILQKELICPICSDSAMGGETHYHCQKTYGLDGLWSLGIYKGSLREAIKKLKYGKVTSITEALVDILVDYWITYQPYIKDLIKDENWVVVPVPLHWFRGNFRGFNQSALLGQILSKKLGLDYSEALKRTRYTRSQVKLKSQQRIENIKGAFSLARNSERITNNYLLIDDVWTTGSTLKECCEVLKKAGAKSVWALTLAR